VVGGLPESVLTLTPLIVRKRCSMVPPAFDVVGGASGEVMTTRLYEAGISWHAEAPAPAPRNRVPTALLPGQFVFCSTLQEAGTEIAALP